MPLGSLPSSYQTVRGTWGTISSSLPSPLTSARSPHSKLPLTSMTLSGQRVPSVPMLRYHVLRFSCHEQETTSGRPSPSTSTTKFMKSRQ